MRLRPAMTAKASAAVLALFAVWTFATWFLEGRIETLLRPEAVADRVAYALVANLLIGIVLALAVLGLLIRSGCLTRNAAGFGGSTPSAVRLTTAVVLGLALFALQGPPSLDPVVLLNAFCQVLVVSVAEVIVCWAVVGAMVEAVLKPHGRAVSIIGAAVVASAAFGIYHFAHSAPFNSIAMVALLSIVGLVTSGIFFATRDVYATILFHNFLGLFGVVQALVGSDQLSAYAAVQLPLLVMAAASLVVLALSDLILIRRPGGSRRVPPRQ